MNIKPMNELKPRYHGSTREFVTVLDYGVAKEYVHVTQGLENEIWRILINGNFIDKPATKTLDEAITHLEEHYKAQCTHILRAIIEEED